MINTDELKRKIAYAGFNQTSLANALGISRRTLSDKINGRSPLTSDLIIEMCELLNITDNDDKIHIFLPRFSPKRD